MRSLMRIGFFVLGMMVGYILAPRREGEIRRALGRLEEARARLEAMRSDFQAYRQVHPDDLTAIKGIGDVFRCRLRDAGIVTYRQLADSDPDALRRILELETWQRPNIEAWIAQARDRVRRPD